MITLECLSLISVVHVSVCSTTPQFFNIEVALTSKPKTTNYKPLVVGVSMGGGVVAAVLALVIIMARRKRKPKQTEERSQPFWLFST